MTDPVTTETTLAQAVGAAISARNVAVTAKNDAVDAKVETEALVEIARGLKNNASDAAASAATALSGVDAAIATALDGAVASVVASATAEINADIPAAIDAEVGPASAPYIAQAESARDDSVAAKTAAETARDNALAAERRIRQQSLGTFADDAAAVAWAAAQSPAITIITGTSYLNSTTDIFRYAVVTAGPTITWHDVTEDEAAQAALATASATAAQNALSDFLTRYVGPFNSTPTYVGDTAPWSIGALYWNRLQTKFFVWNGSGWDATDATAQQAKNDAVAAANSAIQVLAGSGSEDYTVNGVCAFQHGAVLSFPKGLAVLGGNLVATSSFITPSTAEKTVFNPDGTARRTSTNELAQSWRNGTRFGFLEANGFENLVTTPETPSGWFAGAGSVASTANGYRGIFNRATITSGATGAPVLASGKIMTSGQKLSFSATFKAGTLDKPSFGFFNITAGSFAAADANCYARIKSGPGSLVKGSGTAMWRIEGAVADTEIEAWCIASASCTLYLLVYDVDAVAGTPSAGKTFDICCPQVGVGGPRSYVPNNTPCAGDIWQLASGLLAQQLGQNATFIIRATLLNGSPAADWIYQLLGDELSSMLYVDNANFSANMWDSFSTANLPIYFPTSTPVREIGVAMTTSKDGHRKICINGGPVAHDNKSQYSNSATTLTLGGGSVAYRSDLEIKEIVSMAAFVDNDDALRVHARPYA